MSDMPRACFLALDMKGVDAALTEKVVEAVGALYDVPTGAPPKGAKLAKPPITAG